MEAFNAVPGEGSFLLSNWCTQRMLCNRRESWDARATSLSSTRRSYLHDCDTERRHATGVRWRGIPGRWIDSTFKIILKSGIWIENEWICGHQTMEHCFHGLHAGSMIKVDTLMWHYHFLHVVSDLQVPLSRRQLPAFQSRWPLPGVMWQLPRQYSGRSSDCTYDKWLHCKRWWSQINQWVLSTSFLNS